MKTSKTFDDIIGAIIIFCFIAFMIFAAIGSVYHDNALILKACYISWYGTIIGVVGSINLNIQINKMVREIIEDWRTQDDNQCG
jgi:hypothetical protein